MPLDQGWKWGFDSLIESPAQPRSEWIVGPLSRLGIAMDWCSLSPQQITSSLKTHGVRTQCELDFCGRESNGTNDQNFFVGLVVCEHPTQTHELWKQVVASQKEWELKPSRMAGDAMLISNGGNSIAGKTWFVRANMLASVAGFFMPQDGASQFAVKLDNHLINCLNKF
jgi:hypothetical protein